MRTLSTGCQRPHPRIITRSCPFHLLTATTRPRGQLTCSSLSPYGRAPTPISVLRIEADPPDKSAFNRGYFYRTVLTLLGEQTYPQQLHVDIHAEAAPPKRRRMSRTAIESVDIYPQT